MKQYVIKVKLGSGTAVYQFDSRERAMEIVSQLRDENAEFETNFE